MTRYVLEIPDTPLTPDYVTPLVSFIDSEQSCEFLNRAVAGEVSIRNLVDTLIEHDALPFDSAERFGKNASRHTRGLMRIWRAVLAMSREK